MGFGILFVACFLTYFGALTPISAFTYVLGTALMLSALYKLSFQNKAFAISTLFDGALLLLSVVVVAMYVFGVQNGLYNVLITIQTVSLPLLLFPVHIAIYILAKEVELRKIQGWCIVNSIFVVINLACYVALMFVKNEIATPRLGLVYIVTEVLYSAMLLFILFNCYVRICYEDDKEMEKEGTGVPVLDFLNKLFNKATDKNRKNQKNEPFNKGGK